MKLEKEFKNFLEKTVNLNPTRMAIADGSVETMTSILQANEIFGEHFIDAEPQGSIRQRTIIKPTKPGKDFDVDLLVEMRVFEGWEAKDYLLNLADEFRAMDRYKDKVDTRGKNRCVTIDYENDFHVDIVPTIKTGSGYVIMNKETNQFEPTDGDGYAVWFARKGTIVGGDGLASVVRLVKYIRDAKASFEAKSILLTTLMGHQVLETDQRTTQYSDLPTTFLTIITRLDSFLQMNPAMPRIDNPALPGENFNRHWDQTKYEKFRTKIHEYSVQAQDAYSEQDAGRSLEKWQKIFGKEFVGPSILSSITHAITSFVGGLKVGNYSHRQTLKDVGITDPGSYSFPIKITASLYWGRIDHKEINRTYKGTFTSGALLEPHRWLKYQANADLEPHHRLYWQVVNTGPHAREMRKLRGEIEPGTSIKWEPSLFTGVHWVECFVVDSRTNVCIGRSGPFYVVFKNTYYPYEEVTWS